MSLDGDDEETSRAPKHVRYEGEDVSATTDQELIGWYAYPIAAEVFAVVAVGRSSRAG
jgi:UMF1 family MFS transporter